MNAAFPRAQQAPVLSWWRGGAAGLAAHDRTEEIHVLVPPLFLPGVTRHFDDSFFAGSAPVRHLKLMLKLITKRGGMTKT